MHGKTKQAKQRFKCQHCGKTYTWQEKANKKYRERIWFERWVKEGYCLRQVADQSGWSEAKIKRIKAYWLDQTPPERDVELELCKYVIFDGTYFSKEFCFMLLYDSRAKRTVSSLTGMKEGYRETRSWFSELRERGLVPTALTMDGNLQVKRAMNEVWPEAVVQRCLYHIKHQSEMWLRQYPKTELARDLKRLIQRVCNIESHAERELFWESFLGWKDTHRDDILGLRPADKVEGDTIRAYRMVENAYQDMFHYLDDAQIERTSNQLECFFSHLKRRYRQHAGLRREHLDSYLKWYIYLSNT